MTVESIEPSPHQSRLQESLQHLPKVGWLERLRRWSERERGDDVVSRNGHGSDDGFEIPKPTHMVGSYTEPIQWNQPPSGPSQAEIDNRALIDEAMAIEDPWADDEPPPLYSRRTTRS
jgi:hypothetical protein